MRSHNTRNNASHVLRASTLRARSASKLIRHMPHGGKRVRGVREERNSFTPPEDWHEPQSGDSGYEVLKKFPGAGYRHVLSEQEVRDRLDLLPESFIRPLEVVQFATMTRKKRLFPCYGMQWGTTIYLYPLEESLVEWSGQAPKPSQLIEARMYGAEWKPDRNGCWRLEWTEANLKDFYLNNVLIHELGHLLDDRNSRCIDRERYAEWFAMEYGFRASRGRR